MIRIKSWNSAYWGYIRTARESYPCHEKVNAFVGPSGSGKTTLMDAIRIALGDAKFENNRSMDHYLHPDSNWAVVKVSFWNRTVEGRPFAAAGRQTDTVTVCVRIDRSTGKPERGYYLFDGDFEEIIELGQNPKLYKTCCIEYREYLRLLESAGITAAFRRLMTMRPEDVQNVVDMAPHQLFQRIFELKGQKQIQDKHDETQVKVQGLILRENQTRQELERAQGKLIEYEQKKALFEEHRQRETNHHKLSLLLLKRRFWEGRRELAQQREEQQKTMARKEELLTQSNQLSNDLKQCQSDLSEVKRTQCDIEVGLEAARQKEVAASGKYAVLENKLTEQREAVQEAESIPLELLEGLDEKLAEAEQSFSEAAGRLNNLEAAEKELLKQLAMAKTGQSMLPNWVADYQAALRRAQIPATMLADCVSIRAEFLPWQEAIEALLGRERYRTVVAEPQQLAAKKLQELHEYGARVCLPREPHRSPHAKLLKGKYSSVRAAMTVEREPLIGGYLDRYHDIYLVDTVEEGHQLQREGYTSITRRGLLQDGDGAVFLKTQELVCGSLAQQRNLERSQSELKRVQEQLHETRSTREYSKKQLNDYSALKAKVEKLPELRNAIGQLAEQTAQAQQEFADAQEQVKLLSIRLKEAGEHVTILSAELVRLQDQLVALVKEIQESEARAHGYRGRIGQLEQEVSAAEQELRTWGYDDQGLAALDREVERDRLFIREDGSEWSIETLRDCIGELSTAIQRFHSEHPDINPALIALVEPQKNHVARLTGDLDKVLSEREEWQSRLAAAEVALRNHVRETMEQYLDEFNAMAGLLGAKSIGKFIQDGPNYSQWQLQLKIGFDGKEPKPYYDSVFSKGQRAAISIMLILAAVNNQRDGMQNSLMFLDEPTSRVDDYRANEIGALLQRTQIQYFITHQTSASLQSVEWIDYCCVISKLREGEQFADDPIFEARRVAS